MSVLLLLLLCACSATLAVPTVEYYEVEEAELYFERFIQEYNKYYADENEKQIRFQIFKDNLKQINRMNVRSTHAVFGITKFTDLTEEEFVNTYTGLERDSNLYKFACPMNRDIPKVNAPESHDWRLHDAVTRVKDQKTCGSCYAFSVVGNIESQYAIKHQRFIELSEQQIVDCDTYSHGCAGGHPAKSFTTLINLGGIQTEESYPYVGKQQNCNFDASKVAVKVVECKAYNLTSQEALKQLLYSIGPLSIGVKATAFNKYKGGVFTDEMCNHGSINHAVLLVGYGTAENGMPYWIIKNSWGTDFGENGYIRVQRGESSDSCGMMNDKFSYISSALI